MSDPDSDSAFPTDTIENIAADLGIPLPDPHVITDMTAETIADADDLSLDTSVGPGSINADRSVTYDADGEYNAWITRCHVTATDDGPLAGERVGVKDNLALAGYPMTCGSEAFKKFEPEIDSTAVSRLLRAGASIVGKTNMDAFAFGGTGDLQEFGSTLNPADPDYLAGGSSSGSAAAVAARTCDIGLGTDQAGSVRGPSAWCGCVGMKPTHGLVPYTGGFSTDRSLDHVGIITRTVETNARALGTAAGPDLSDGVLLDPRQTRSDPARSPTYYLPPEDGDLNGLTVGIVAEGFDRPVSDPGVDRTVRGAIDTLVDAGAEARVVSLPSLELAGPLMNAVVALSVTTGPFEHGGVQTGANGWHWTRLATAIGDLVADRPEKLPLPVVVLRVIGTVLAEQDKTVTYAEGKNAALAADRRIQAHLKECDVLALPTTPMTAFENRPELPWLDRIGRNADALVNTALFDHTGHPALTVPCGTHDGLPVGLQLVGPRRSERELYRIAAAV